MRGEQRVARELDLTLACACLGDTRGPRVNPVSPRYYDRRPSPLFQWDLQGQRAAHLTYNNMKEPANQETHGSLSHLLLWRRRAKVEKFVWLKIPELIFCTTGVKTRLVDLEGSQALLGGLSATRDHTSLVRLWYPKG